MKKGNIEKILPIWCLLCGVGFLNCGVTWSGISKGLTSNMVVT